MGKSSLRKNHKEKVIARNKRISDEKNKLKNQLKKHLNNQNT